MELTTNNQISLEMIISKLTIENCQLKNRISELEFQLKNQSINELNYVDKNNQITEMLSNVSQEIRKKEEAAQLQYLLHQHYQEELQSQSYYERDADSKKRKRVENYDLTQHSVQRENHSSSNYDLTPHSMQRENHSSSTKEELSLDSEEIYTKNNLVFFLILPNKMIKYSSESALTESIFKFDESIYTIKIVLLNSQNEEIENYIFDLKLNEKVENVGFAKWLKDKIYDHIFYFLKKYSNIHYRYELIDYPSSNYSSKEQFLDFLVKHHLKENNYYYHVNVTSYSSSKKSLKYTIKNICKLSINIKGNYTLREWFKRGLEISERIILKNLSII